MQFKLGVQFKIYIKKVTYQKAVLLQTKIITRKIKYVIQSVIENLKESKKD